MKKVVDLLCTSLYESHMQTHKQRRDRQNMALSDPLRAWHHHVESYVECVKRRDGMADYYNRLISDALRKSQLSTEPQHWLRVAERAIRSARRRKWSKTQGVLTMLGASEPEGLWE